jgi:hypothetical protein
LDTCWKWLGGRDYQADDIHILDGGFKDEFGIEVRAAFSAVEEEDPDKSNA